ncbi:ATP-binding protein [Pseudooceanicola nanhaiensis]|uniref:ATP-binding protein n=1 Tax=Pseudooceanicola nanhaiensis TaxID=375761 RepID=UPI001CD80457|nr:ATP-binding protein [Pseudooceanicola nanhaiensis]MCA0921412.1 sensor histidine kinase N-terminal domain-containing protein [Pseudooceanicola nanhaiensis]
MSWFRTMSLRLRVFLILAFATAVVWLCAVIWIETSTRAEVERVLDARLSEAARMVSSLVADHRIELAGAHGAPVPVPVPFQAGEGYARQLSCQIWSLDGQLVGRSDGAPDGRLSGPDVEGWSDSVVGGEPWRVYTVINEPLGLRIMVGDSMAVREGLVRDVIEGLVLPALILLPLLAGLIWVIVAGGLAPLERFASGLAQRSPADLGPMPSGPIPREIRPVRDALDTLFEKLSAARDVERDFTTYAAHELKTPLAGLRTQAQVARMAPDAATRDAALAAIELSVTRTDRMVRQLLDLAEVERAEIETGPCDPAALVAAIAADLQPLAARREVTLRLDGEAAGPWETNGYLLSTALRNVTENAVLATPGGGTVTLRWYDTAQGGEVTVSDTGPGIPDDLRARATDRFVRGSDGPPGGSGLGLSIVESAMARLGGDVVFERRADGQDVCLVIGRMSRS